MATSQEISAEITTGGNFPEQCNTVRHCEHNSNLDKSVLRRLVRLMPFMSSTLQSSKIPLDFYANLYFPENALKSMATLLSETRDSGGKDATEQIRKGAVKNGYVQTIGEYSTDIVKNWLNHTNTGKSTKLLLQSHLFQRKTILM